MWIMPTLSRPQQCAEVLSRITSIGHSTPGVVFVNGPDNGYLNFIEGYLPRGWVVVFHPTNIGCIGALNEVFRLYPDEPWYGFIGDDEFLMVDSTYAWDTLLVASAGEWDVSHGWEDFNQGNRAQGYVCIGGNLVRQLGYLAIPSCWHWFGFDCMYEWLSAHMAYGGGGCLRLKLVPEVRVEHRHAYAGKSPLDACYELGRSRSEEDRNIFWGWVTKEMPAIAEGIRMTRPKP